jgi:hypothetical protein
VDKKQRDDLKALLKILRVEGVLEFKMTGLELKLSPDAMKVKVKVETDGKDIGAPPPDGKWSEFPSGELSPEELMYYSSGGTPENSPFRTDGGEGEA